MKKATMKKPNPGAVHESRSRAGGGGQAKVKERIDVALVARGLCDSREKAARLLLAGAANSPDAEEPRGENHERGRLKKAAREEGARRRRSDAAGTPPHFGEHVVRHAAHVLRRRSSRGGRAKRHEEKRRVEGARLGRADPTGGEVGLERTLGRRRYFF